MHEYKVCHTPAALFTGEIGLSPLQANRRHRALKKCGKGLYKIISPIQFKIGEVIKLVKIPKGLEACLKGVNEVTTIKPGGERPPLEPAATEDDIQDGTSG